MSLELASDPSTDQLAGHALPARRAMPARIVLVRHGESDANLIIRAIKEGIITDYPEDFRATPDREYRLTRRGREQAVATGRWLREQYPEGFDRIFCSDHVRAFETAGLVCIAAGWDAEGISVDPQLSERSWGDYVHLPQKDRDRILEARRRDPIHTRIANGESLAYTRARARSMLDRAEKELSGKTILVFSHGEFIESFWSEMSAMPSEKQRAFFSSEAGNIRNCQVVEFATMHSSAKESDGELRWVRSSCPAQGTGGEWDRLHAHRSTPADLLEVAGSYPRLPSAQVLAETEDG